MQCFNAVVRPLGETRPGWKVLRVLGELLGLSGFTTDSSATVLAAALPEVLSGQHVAVERLNNRPVSVSPLDMEPAADKPCVATIYQLDGLVRRAPSLQRTADAQGGPR